MKTTAIAAVLAGVAALVFASMSVRAASPAPTPCTPSGGLNFVCGMSNPEDLVQIPKTRWIVASGMSEGSGMYLIDSEAKTAQRVFGSTFFKLKHDKAAYGACPADFDAQKASLHGLSIRAGQGGKSKLYATNHGGRETIEAFEVDASGATPTITWVGCAPMPEGLAANSVSSFSDGSIITTVLTTAGKTIADALAGRNTGAVYLWSPGATAFRVLPGTELPGDNGIEVSADDKEFYVVASGSKRIVAFSRANPSKALRFAQLKEFAPDNVHWTSDGRLITGGMNDNEPACGGAPTGEGSLRGCPRGYIIATVDPKSMVATELARGPANPAFSAATIGLLSGGNLWIGSFYADRVGYRALK
jgi:hypothetical protein